MMISGQRSRRRRFASSHTSVVVAPFHSVSGLRAWMCTIEAPASYASPTDSASSSDVSGRASLYSLPWMPPFAARQMMTGGMPPATLSM